MTLVKAPPQASTVRLYFINTKQWIIPFHLFKFSCIFQHDEYLIKILEYNEHKLFWGFSLGLDSFISIKFEDNGKASWDHKTNHKKESRIESVVVPTKPGGGRGPRWKNGIGHLLQMPGKHHVSSSGNVRRGWSLRMRRTTTTTTTTTTTITTMTD